MGTSISCGGAEDRKQEAVPDSGLTEWQQLTFEQEKQGSVIKT